MTQTQERTDVITEAVALIDRGLTGMLDRGLVSTDEVANLLLDVRSVLVADVQPQVPVDLEVTGAAN